MGAVIGPGRIRSTARIAGQRRSSAAHGPGETCASGSTRTRALILRAVGAAAPRRAAPAGPLARPTSSTAISASPGRWAGGRRTQAGRGRPRWSGRSIDRFFGVHIMETMEWGNFTGGLTGRVDLRGGNDRGLGSTDRGRTSLGRQKRSPCTGQADRLSSWWPDRQANPISVNCSLHHQVFIKEREQVGVELHLMSDG